MNFHHTNSFFFYDLRVEGNPALPTWLLLFSFLSSAFCLISPKMTTGKGEKGRERERARALLAGGFISVTPRVPSAGVPCRLPDAPGRCVYRVDTVFAVGWLLLASGARKSEAPCSTCLCWSLKMEVLTFKTEGDEKEGSGGVGGHCRPTGAGQRPLTWTTSNGVTMKIRLFIVFQLLETYDIYSIYHIYQHNIFACQNRNSM